MRYSCLLRFGCVALVALGAAAARAANYAEHFGISIGAPVYNGQVTFTEQVASDLNAMGVRWIRVEFIAEGDTIPYAKYDEIINRANAHNIETLGLLTYQTKFYSWDPNNWANDAWQDTFRDRCVQIVDHYRNFASGPVRFWEIWNEPDSMGGMPAAKFGRLLSIVYPAIKTLDPQATVVSGGLTGYWTPPYAYMRSVYQSSYFTTYKNTYGIYPFDIFGLHPYDWTRDPYNYLATYMNGTYGLRKLLNDWGDGYKRMWLTEYGWNSSPTADSSIKPGGVETYNEWLQGEFFTHGFTTTQTLTYPSSDFGPYVDKTFLFCYRDFDLGTPQTRELFGTVRLTSDHKPLFYRYAGMAKNALQNLALTATATASSMTGPSESPDKACDGTKFTKWAATTPADAEWLELDLGAWCEVSEFRVWHAEMGHEPDSFNTTGFQILTSGDDVNWTADFLVSNTNRQPYNALTYPNAKTLRYVRLQITDACVADAAARIPEFEVWGRRVEQANLRTSYELGLTLANLSRSVSATDLLTGQAATFETGYLDLANEVYAFSTATTGCLDMQWSTPVPGFYAGYPDPSPAAHVLDLTDGSGSTVVVLRDYARASAILRYDLAQPTDIRELLVYAANAGKDGRVLQDYDVYVSTNNGATFTPLAVGVKTADFGYINTGAGASVTRAYPAYTGRIVENATNLRFVFYAVSSGNLFLDPWQGNRSENSTYQTSCPSVDVRDSDGYGKAFVAPILAEIDVFAARDGDGDADGDVDYTDWLAFCGAMNGPDNASPAINPRAFDFAPRDGDVDVVDFAGFQATYKQPG